MLFRKFDLFAKIQVLGHHDDDGLERRVGLNLFKCISVAFLDTAFKMVKHHPINLIVGLVHVITFEEEPPGKAVVREMGFIVLVIDGGTVVDGGVIANLIGNVIVFPFLSFLMV